MTAPFGPAGLVDAAGERAEHTLLAALIPQQAERLRKALQTILAHPARHAESVEPL
jgi:hypothetical protein